MDVKIKIQCDNAAFTDSPGFEVARILREAATTIENNFDSFPLRDINGNRVGMVDVYDDRDEEEDDEEEDEFDDYDEYGDEDLD